MAFGHYEDEPLFNDRIKENVRLIGDGGTKDEIHRLFFQLLNEFPCRSLNEIKFDCLIPLDVVKLCNHIRYRRITHGIDKSQVNESAVGPRIGLHDLQAAAQFFKRFGDIRVKHFPVLREKNVATPFFKKGDAHFFFQVPYGPVQAGLRNI